MSSWALGLLVLGFVASDVYGHVALKLGTRRLQDVQGAEFWSAYLQDPWVLSALGAWGISVLLWVSVLRKAPLFQAFSMASVKYIALALVAALVLKEAISTRQALGMALIGAGILLVKLD